MSAERAYSGVKGQIAEMTVSNRVYERILDQCAEVIELADQPASVHHSGSMCRHGRIQICLVHQAMEVDDEVSRRVQIAFNEAGMYEARKPGPAVTTVDLDDTVTRSQILFVHDRLHRAPRMRERSSRLDRALLVDRWKPGRSKLHQRAIPAHVQLERPPRIGIRRTEGWEGIRRRHIAQIEDQPDPVGTAGTAPVVSGHDGATLPTAAFPAGGPGDYPSRTTGGG